MNNLHVRHVRDALERQFRGLIDLTDLTQKTEAEQGQAFLSRALTALAARYVSGCDAAKAASCVIDGFDDGGIDAVVADEDAARLWLIQAKWSDRGTAGLGEDGAGKMRDALDYILNSRFDRFNKRFQKMASEVDDVISNPNVRITLVVALLGASKLSDTVQSIFDRIRRDANGAQEMVDLVILGVPDFHNIVRSGMAPPDIDLDITLDSAGFSVEPYLAYQRIVAAADVASWYEQYKDGLFDQNIRKALGVTVVNRGIIETLTRQPTHFLYFNNGITVLSGVSQFPVVIMVGWDTPRV